MHLLLDANDALIALQPPLSLDSRKRSRSRLAVANRSVGRSDSHWSLARWLDNSLLILLNHLEQFPTGKPQAAEIKTVTRLTDVG